ncbi:Lichenan-specific phosphotransferase enzyme IIA component (plasmid) [Lactiplantibacillus plantarum]|nr:Lichenan-specific phosphotransferase enzyme IIA component [Lactiplantibacillus plantarum]
MQTKMLTAEANGKHSQLTLLTVHSQDHLMTAITFIDLAQELIKVYHKLADSDSK